MRHWFHHEETLVSSRGDTSFIMMRLIKDTDKKDARCVKKEQETSEKGCGNLLEKERKQGSKYEYIYIVAAE